MHKPIPTSALRTGAIISAGGGGGRAKAEGERVPLTPADEPPFHRGESAGCCSFRNFTRRSPPRRAEEGRNPQCEVPPCLLPSPSPIAKINPMRPRASRGILPARGGPQWNAALAVRCKVVIPSVAEGSRLESVAIHRLSRRSPQGEAGLAFQSAISLLLHRSPSGRNPQSKGSAFERRLPPCIPSIHMPKSTPAPPPPQREKGRPRGSRRVADKAAGRGLRELRRSPEGGACESSLLLRKVQQTRVGYNNPYLPLVAPRVKR